jgi:hypothetical protein
MKLKRLLFPLALAGMLMGSEAKPPSLVFEAKEKKSTITLALGQELKIMLPTTNADYIWQIVANDRRYLKETSKIAPMPGDAMAGATVSFLTNRGGHTRLGFAYVKSTESSEAAPVDTRDIAVTIVTN